MTDRELRAFDHCHQLDAAQRAENKDAAERGASRRLMIALALSVLFVCVEAIGAHFANSLALFSDVIHLISDSSNLFVAVIAIRLSRGAPSKKYNLGRGRFQTLGALATVVLLWYLMAFVVYEAVERMRSGQYEIQSTYMIVTAAMAIAFNLIILLVLRGTGHGHSHFGLGHGHSHSNHTRLEEEGGCEASAPARPAASGADHINVRAATIHVIGDLAQSLGVLISSVVIYFYPSAKIVDPVITLIFVAIVLLTTLKILVPVLAVLLQKTPAEVDMKEVTERLLALPSVVRVHDLACWSLTDDTWFFSAHLVVRDAPANGARAQKAAAKMLEAAFPKLDKITIQIDELDESVMDCCTKCQPLVD